MADVVLCYDRVNLLCSLRLLHEAVNVILVAELVMHHGWELLRVHGIGRVHVQSLLVPGVAGQVECEKGVENRGLAIFYYLHLPSQF